MSNTESDYMAVDPEMERIWREDDDPSFTDIRATMSDETDESEQPTDEVTDSVEEETSDDTATEEAEESQSDEVTDEVAEDDGMFTIKANDMELKLTKDEMIALASKGIDYTKKTQTLAPWRKQISAIQEAQLGPDDVNLMIDAFKGNKEAIAEVLRRTKVDPLEVDTDSKDVYVPNQYGKDETVLAIEEVVSEISSDPEYATTVKVVDDLWDSASREQMRSNPALIRGLHEEIKMGRYVQVAPMAAKMKTMDMVQGRQVLSDLEYYQTAVDQFIMQQQQNDAVNGQVQRQQEIQQKAPARKAAATPKRMSGGKTVIDYLDDSPEGEKDFEEWLKSVKNR